MDMPSCSSAVAKVLVVVEGSGGHSSGGLVVVSGEAGVVEAVDDAVDGGGRAQGAYGSARAYFCSHGVSRPGARGYCCHRWMRKRRRRWRRRWRKRRRIRRMGRKWRWAGAEGVMERELEECHRGEGVEGEERRGWGESTWRERKGRRKKRDIIV